MYRTFPVFPDLWTLSRDLHSINKTQKLKKADSILPPFLPFFLSVVCYISGELGFVGWALYKLTFSCVIKHDVKDFSQISSIFFIWLILAEKNVRESGVEMQLKEQLTFFQLPFQALKIFLNFFFFLIFLISRNFLISGIFPDFFSSSKIFLKFFPKSSRIFWKFS